MMPRVDTAPPTLPARKNAASSVATQGEDFLQFDAALADYQEGANNKAKETPVDKSEDVAALQLPQVPQPLQPNQDMPAQAAALQMLFTSVLEKAPETKGKQDVVQEPSASRPSRDPLSPQSRYASTSSGMLNLSADHPALEQDHDVSDMKEFFPEVKIEKIKTSVHFAPAQPDPVRQIVAGAAQALSEPVPGSALPDMSETVSSPVKTVQLRLEPENLGSVTLHLRLSGNQLSVRVDVAESETLQMLSKEHDRLHKSLASETCSVERLEIRASSPVADAAPVQKSEESSRFAGGSAQREGESHGQSRARAEPDSRQSRRNRQQDDDVPAKTSDRSSVRGLYL